MDYASCRVVYLDKSITEDRVVTILEPNLKGISVDPEVVANLDVLLSTFKEVHTCGTGVSCLQKIRKLETVGSSCIPTIIFVQAAIESAADQDSRATSSDSTQDPGFFDLEKVRQDSGASGDFSGLALIKHLNADINRHNLSKLALPVALVPNPKLYTVKEVAPSSIAERKVDSIQPSNGNKGHSEHIMRCVQAGAVDVIFGELSSDRIQALTAHAHRAHLEGIKEQPTFLEQRRMRKRSWVGVDEEKPYAYLRESMVSTLMESICKPHSAIGAISSANTSTIKAEREKIIERAITTWSFSAHSFSDDELLHAAFLMLKHALSMEELEKWRIPTDELRNFLLASRSAYNSFVLYHNFRHVVDVLQACFYFLLQLGTLPPHPAAHPATFASKAQSPIAALLTPFDALVLLISAIGHDVGHPGVNNAFLVALKAPLAQLYNDNSVLEAFHCAAYSQILRRYWNVAFEDTDVRKLLIKSILATDMQMHFKYMADLGNLQEKLHHNGGTDGWSPQQLDEYKVLSCGLLIKCADISNVARPFEIAARWSDILQQEFSRQGEMERIVGIPTTLFGGPPELGNVEKLGQSQIGFMNVFAYPLFESVADVLPGMKFGIEEIKSNQAIWKQKIEIEKARADAEAVYERSEGFQSPRSGSPDHISMARSPETSHPEGIPASGTTLQSPGFESLKSIQATPDIESIPSTNVGNVGQAISTPNVSSSQFDRKASFGLPMIPTGSFDPHDGTDRSFNVFASSTMANVSAAIPGKAASGVHGDSTSASTTTGLFAKSNENIPPSQSSTPGRPTTPLASGIGGASTPRRHDTDASPSPPISANFSRPMSMRPYHSHTRSSAPSNVPTIPSTVIPNSPTETQATSLLTEGSDVAPESVDLDRPSSGYSSALATSTASSRSPGRANAVKTAPPSGGIDSRTTVANGHVEDRGNLRKKGSRFRLDFWKKKRTPEPASP